MKYLVKTCMTLIFFTTNATADIKNQVTSTIDEANAQAECGAYIDYTYQDYSLAGFNSATSAKNAKTTHLEKAAQAAEKFVKLASENKVDGKYMVFRDAGKVCIGEGCFAKAEYIEAMFILGGIQKASDDITKMKIDCPSNAWFPCMGGEPVDNWKFKAANLYKSKNCKLLLR
jgi:hypothetical protein